MGFLYITIFALLAGLVTCGLTAQVETNNYITDHKCKVTRTKLRNTVNTTTTSYGVLVTVPTVTTDHLYECEIEGDRGRSFWN